MYNNQRERAWHLTKINMHNRNMPFSEDRVPLGVQSCVYLCHFITLPFWLNSFSTYWFSLQCLSKKGWLLWCPRSNSFWCRVTVTHTGTCHHFESVTSVWFHIRYTVETLYNTVNFCWNTHKRHSIARPKGRGMGCLLWVQRATYCVDLSKLSSIKYLL